MGRVLLTPSCTSALELAALLCELGPGDEVVMPSFTFPATANSVARTGATPVFVDVRADTMNIDEQLIPAALTERTKAIFVMHYGGVVCEMDAINDNAAQRGLVVVEDTAQGIDASYHGRAAGSLAPLAAFSFHHTKSVTCGEGGALCVNDPALLERAETVHEHGTNRKQFLRGAVEKYTWVDTGTSGLLNELACAQQLVRLPVFHDLTVEDQQRVIDEVLGFFG